MEDVYRVSMIIILKLSHYAEIANSASGRLMQNLLVHTPPTSHMWGSDTTLDGPTLKTPVYKSSPQGNSEEE